MGDAPRAPRAGADAVIRFAHPWLLLPALAAVAFVAFRLRSLPLRGLRRRLVQLAMGGAALATALALAGLELGKARDRGAARFLLDVSRSVEGATNGDARRTRLAEATQAMGAEDVAGLVVFGAEAATEHLPSARPSLATEAASVPRDATDLEAAIRRGLADLPAGYAGRLVLVSDGAATRGAAIGAAALASARGVASDVHPLEVAPRPEIAVERVRLPRAATPGEPVELRVVTRASQETPARVRVLRDGQLLAEGETTLAAGTDVLRLRDAAPEPGVHRYDVLLEPSGDFDRYDAGRTNNEGGAFLRVLGARRALVVAGAPEEAEALAEALGDGGPRVELVGPRRVPASLGELATYDLVALTDLNARRLSRPQMEALRSYVRDLGGGLLMAGARESFGLGGYAHTPVEEALPAHFDLRQRKDRLSLAMVLAIDKSGSMGMEATPGTTKLDLANEAAARSASLLAPQDRVGVMHVDTEVSWTQPMVAVQDPRAIAAATRRAGPGGGGIYVDVTMDAAFAALRAERTQLRHFLLFSDGSDSERLGGTDDQVRAGLRAGITTSVVSMGMGPDTAALERFSRLGGGRFYIVDDLQELPRIFTQETLEASRAALVEEPFRPSAGDPSAVLAGVDVARAPALGGYALVNAKGRARTLLRASDEDPLLAVWQYGVGRAAIFATDVGAELGRPWLGWPGFRTLFAQLGRALARAPERRDARRHVTFDGGGGRGLVEAVSEAGRTRNYLDLDGVVAGPGGEARPLTLAQTAPGRYEARFAAEAPGPYLVTVREEDAEGEAGTARLVGSAGVVRPAGAELRGAGTDRVMLERLAALTGGQVRGSLGEVFRDRPRRSWAHAPLAPTLLRLALVLLLSGVALRRLVLPRRRRRERPRTGAAPVRPGVAGLAITRGARAREVPPPFGAAPPPVAPAAPREDTAPASEEAPEETPKEARSLAERLLAEKKKP